MGGMGDEQAHRVTLVDESADGAAALDEQETGKGKGKWDDHIIGSDWEDDGPNEFLDDVDDPDYVPHCSPCWRVTEDLDGWYCDECTGWH